MVDEMETVKQGVRQAGPSQAPLMLIADDQPDILEALRLLLKQHGYEVEAAASPAGILRALEARRFDVLLMDLNYTRDTTSGQEGLDLLSRIQAIDAALPVVVMTAWGSVELAVEAMHRGVADFVLKPWDNSRLLSILSAQIAQGQVRRQAAQQESRNRQLGGEILEAKEIQRGLLPKVIPQFPGYEISGAWQPARVVGGDYFDVYGLSPSLAVLCIADVVGKGMPAALLMSNLQAAVKGSTAEAFTPNRLCTKVNGFVCSNIGPEKFITLFYGLLDVRGRKLTYTNAGHNAPVLVRADGSCARLRQGGPVLGVFPKTGYEQGEVQLDPADRLVLFTDGVIEAAGPQDEEFGEERLIRLLVENRSAPAQTLQEKILQTATEFTGGDFQDDATLLVIAVGAP
jgi:sigma-B regulation protein RsbU (phosphoserine phosphatase)